jgi:hypothetical protein
MIEAGIFIGAAIARKPPIAKGWCRSAHRVSRFETGVASAGN